MTATAESTLESTMNDQASSWEVQQGGTTSTEELAVVYVYDSFKFADKCGHALPLLRLVREVLCAAPIVPGSGTVTGSSGTSFSLPTVTATASCPICQTPIAYVTEVNKKDEPTVVFKYNKQIYRLTVPSTGSAGAGGAASVSPAEEPWWKKLLGGGGNDNTNEKRIRAATNTMTAQGRIAQVLGMSVDGGMKILSKGKVLYPNPSLTSSEISQQLMDQSPQDTGGSSSSKVALMVVGTIIGHELPPPPSTSKNGNGNDTSSRPWWQIVLGTGQAIVVPIVSQVWNWSWIILHRAMALTSQTLLGRQPPPPAPTTTSDGNNINNTSRPWWQIALGTGQAIVWQVWNWSWIIFQRAMAATSQTLLGHTRQQPPSGGAAGGRRPEEVD